jgi:hypothetical protein
VFRFLRADRRSRDRLSFFVLAADGSLGHGAVTAVGPGLSRPSRPGGNHHRRQVFVAADWYGPAWRRVGNAPFAAAAGTGWAVGAGTVAGRSRRRSSQNMAHSLARRVARSRPCERIEPCGPRLDTVVFWRVSADAWRCGGREPSSWSASRDRAGSAHSADRRCTAGSPRRRSFRGPGGR